MEAKIKVDIVGVPSSYVLILESSLFFLILKSIPIPTSTLSIEVGSAGTNGPSNWDEITSRDVWDLYARIGFVESFIILVWDVSILSTLTLTPRISSILVLSRRNYTR